MLWVLGRPVKGLLITTAVIEPAGGFLLFALPSLAITLLFDPSLETPAGFTVIRLAGCAMLSLGVASGLALRDSQSPAVRSIVAALLFYNCAVVALSLFSSLGLGLSSPTLWPSGFLHAALAAWCGVALWGPAVQSQGPFP